MALVSDDGLVIDRAMGDGHGDPDEVAALSATLAQHATHLGNAAGRGSFHAGVFEYANGMVVLSQAGPTNYVVIVVDPNHNVGALLYHLREEMDEMYYLGWVADYPHPQNFLEVLFHSQAQYNYGQYVDAEVDALLYEAGTEQDNVRSLELYQQVERILVEDAACLPLWFGQNYVLVKSRVRGYSLNPMGFASLNMVSVEGK